jgi:hypothetical protein
MSRKSQGRVTPQPLDEKVAQIRAFYDFKTPSDPVPDNSTNLYDYQPIENVIIDKEEEDDEETSVNRINDYERKVSFYYLWRALIQLYIKTVEENTKNNKNDKKLPILNIIKERHLKTIIINLFCHTRQPFAKSQGIVDKLNSSERDLSYLDDSETSFYSRYKFSGDTRNEVLLLISNNRPFENPYIEHCTKYNDHIHQLLVELMPLLPTVVFALFPLSYLPILAFSSIFYRLLRSNRFDEFSRYHKLRPKPKTPEIPLSSDVNEDDSRVLHQIPFIQKEFIEKKSHYTIMDQHSKLKFNIGKFIVNTRKRLYNVLGAAVIVNGEENSKKKVPSKRRQEDEQDLKPSYFPFVIKNIFATYDNNSTKMLSIDVHFQQNHLFAYFQKLSCHFSETTTALPLKLYLTNMKNSKILSFEKVFQLEFVEDDPSFYHRYFIIGSQEDEEEVRNTVMSNGDTHIQVNNNILQEDMELNSKSFKGNDYWKSNIKMITPSSRMHLGIKVPLIKDMFMKVTQSIHSNGIERYRIHILHHLPHRETVNSEEVLFKKGYFTSYDINSQTLTDKTEFIGIFHHKETTAELLETYLQNHQKGPGKTSSIKESEKLKKQEDFYVVMKPSQSRVSSKMIIHGVVHAELGKENIKKLHKPDDKVIVTIEETIGIINQIDNMMDTETTIEVKERSLEKNVIRIHSPILHHLRNEYKRCIHSLSKSILVLDGEDYNPYDSSSLRVLITGSVKDNDGKKVNIVLSVIPLYDFVKPTMTITSHALGGNWLWAVLNEPNTQTQPVFYATHFPYIRTLFDKKTRKDEYNTVMLKQTLPVDAKSEWKQFGNIVDTDYSEGGKQQRRKLFCVAPFNEQSSPNKGFYVKKTFKDTLNQEVQDLQMTVFLEIIVDTGSVVGHNVIKIIPFIDRRIDFFQSSNKIQLNRLIEKGKSIEIEFVINPSMKNSKIYKDNGMIDKFVVHVRKLLHSIKAFKILYTPKLDKVVYDGDNENLTLQTTDNKLSMYNNVEEEQEEEQEEDSNDVVYSVLQIKEI